jgi:AMP nucleosidase
MKTKEEITANWLPRYTGVKAEDMSDYILLTNFNEYLHRFVAMTGGHIVDANRSMPSAQGQGITMINFGMGSPNAATISDLLSIVQPKAILFLGKCGGLKQRTKDGDFIVPIGAIRGEGASDSYFPAEVPSLPAFMLQRATSHIIRNRNHDYWTGTVYTTNRRVWEHDDAFKEYLRMTRAMAIDMETATLFSAGFHNRLHLGALLLVSDQPMTPEGVKTSESDAKVSSDFVGAHISIGIETLEEIKNQGLSVRHLKF